VAGDFDVQPLGTVAKVRSGYAFKSEDMGSVGLPVVKIKNVVPPTVDITNCERVPEEVILSIPRVERFELKEGDTLIAMTGATVGKVGKFPCTPERHFLNQRVGKVDLTEPAAADYRYLYYVLSQETYVRQMFGIADGSAQANISGSQIESLEVPLPPLAKQKAIAAVLGALDDKIELNRRMNATLEAMARALFQSWFVDFDPVRAKLDGRQPPNLDPTTAALFPDSFQDSELGHIPQGWDVRSLDQIAHYLNGLALQKYPPSDGPTLPVIKIAQLRKGDVAGADQCSAILPPEYIVDDGDVLFSWSGSLEVDLWCGGPGALNQHLFKVTSTEFPKWYYYLWTLHHLDEFRLIAADKATTMGHIQRGHISAANVVVPPRPLLDAMTTTLAPLIDEIRARRIQARTLADLRDTLLPNLISGQVLCAGPTN
jgi:type I restriction enzyme S subunit